MNWITIISCLFLFAFTPIYSKHDNPEKVTQEFKNIENTVQDQQYRVMASTPVLSDLKDGQIVIISSNGWNALMWRYNQDIYKVTGSCVTVRR